MLPPLHSVYRKKLIKECNDSDDQTYLSQLLFEPTVQHIDNMFKLNEKLPGKFKLYFMENPMHAISEIVIDESYWLTEIDIPDKGGLSIPDRLFVNAGTTSKNKM